MSFASLRRLVAGVAVTGVVLVAGALPAAAAPGDVTVDFRLNNVTAPLGAPGGALIGPAFIASDDTMLRDARMTYKLSGDVTGLSLAGAEFSHCDVVSDTELSCIEYFLQLTTVHVGGHFRAYVMADDTAEIGGSATLTASFTAEDVAPVSKTAAVRIAESVDLTAGPTVPVSAAPGAAVQTPISVLNSGDKAVTGAGIVFDNDYALRPSERFSNCRYNEAVLLSCTFDETLEPGQTYQALLPYTLRADTYAPGSTYSGFVWHTAADFAANQAGVAPGTPGTGGKLALRETDTQLRAADQTDLNWQDNYGLLEVKVTGANGTDLVAVGADLKGAAGAVVKAEVGVVNEGPATLNRLRRGGAAAVTRVYVPAGATVVTAPEKCRTVSDDVRIYDCFGKSLFLVREEQRFEFSFRIDDPAGAAGKVAVNEPCECERFRDDLDMANNYATITINSVGGGDGGTGGGDPDDPTLPITGPAGVTIALSGLVVLGLGVAGFVLARRRRTTFVS